MFSEYAHLFPGLGEGVAAPASPRRPPSPRPHCWVATRAGEVVFSPAADAGAARARLGVEAAAEERLQPWPDGAAAAGLVRLLGAEPGADRLPESWVLCHEYCRPRLGQQLRVVLGQRGWARADGSVAWDERTRPPASPTGTAA
jgi:hypothetical protein